MNNTMTEQPILATLVPDQQRLAFLPKTFGRYFLRVEASVYDQMGRLCSQYNGGYWHFKTLSNGGGYLAPSDDQYELIAENGFEGDVSGDAAGIIATLYALNQLCFRVQDNQLLATRYEQLRDFALTHPEASSILVAID